MNLRGHGSFTTLTTWLRSQRNQAAHQLPATPPMSPVRTPPKLAVELVPRTCWFSNVRDHVSPEQWHRLRKLTARQAHARCEICGGRGPQWPVECHEVWQYDEAESVQTLLRLIALCPACHAVKHLGLAELQGHLAAARAHFCEVNQWTESEAHRYFADVWRVWEARSQHAWRLDLSWLRQHGIVVQPKR